MPFSTLYRNGAVQGLFQLTLPPVLLGYAKDDASTSAGLVPASAIKVSVSIEPMLPPPREEPPRLRPGARDYRMQHFAAKWIKRTRRGSRQLSVFVPTADGHQALITKFIRAQEPPPELERSPTAIARYVALIPFLEDALLDSSLDVWNTSDSFLDLCAGDEEEHAVLLCNYLLALNKEAYVILGDAFPRAPPAT